MCSLPESNFGKKMEALHLFKMTARLSGLTTLWLIKAIFLSTICQHPHLFTTSEGLVVAREDSLGEGGDLGFTDTAYTNNVDENRAVFLKDSTGVPLQLSSGEIALKLNSADIDGTSNNFEYTLYTSNNGVIVERVFNQEGVQQDQSNLSASEIKLAEVATGLDLDNDNSIGGTVTSTAHTNNVVGMPGEYNFTIYNTEVGMVSAIGDYSLTVGDDLREIAWNINGSTAAATTQQGFLLLTNNGEGIELNSDQSIVTAKYNSAAGYLIATNGEAVIEVFVANDSGSITQLGFNNAGEQVQKSNSMPSKSKRKKSAPPPT